MSMDDCGKIGVCFLWLFSSIFCTWTSSVCPLSLPWFLFRYEMLMLPYSPRALSRKLLFRIPNQNLLLDPFEQKLSSTSENNVTMSGVAIIVHGSPLSWSSFSARRIWKTSTGKTSMLEIALLIAFLRCAADISGVLISILQKMKLYSIITSDRHSTIQIGTKIHSQLHVRNPSSFSGMNTNCKAFTDRKSSSSKLRSFCCLIAQMQKNTLTIDETIKGMKTRIHRCLLSFISRSTTRNSNISSMRWSDKEMSIDLNWMYESFSIRYCGFLRNTQQPISEPTATSPAKSYIKNSIYIGNQ